MAKHKPLNIILKVFLSDLKTVKFLKYRNVTNLNSLLSHVEKSYKIDYINLYDKESKERIKGISYKDYLNLK